ncbi:MAG TPA: class I SAM-dependent methyltransferase [Burkholderiales bacterium]|nr:class I SAM-dependent methyltransferase [Burkholderiales bacterium]
MRALLCLFLVAGACVVAAQDTEWRVPFISTPDEVVERMLAFAGTRADDYVVDLGSGDGRIVITAARRYGARGLGIELDEALVRSARDNAQRAGVADRASFIQGDVLTADFSAASVVTVYLLPDLIGRLQPRFLSDLKPGTRIVSHAFRMTGWRPDASESLRVAGAHPGQGDVSTLYLWIVPAEVRGTWSGAGMRVRIEQNYQEIDVAGATEATLRGSDIRWRSPAGSFHGRVQGEHIVSDDGRELTRER